MDIGRERERENDCPSQRPGISRKVTKEHHTSTTGRTLSEELSAKSGPVINYCRKPVSFRAVRSAETGRHSLNGSQGHSKDTEL